MTGVYGWEKKVPGDDLRNLNIEQFSSRILSIWFMEAFVAKIIGNKYCELIMCQIVFPNILHVLTHIILITPSMHITELS
jgi:hypothetical protein